jgi:hypothetical protein
VKVEREVFGKNSVLENIVQKAFVAGPEPDGVVGEVGVGPVGAEINQKEGHAVAHFV